MSRIAHCAACSAQKNGIKSRIALHHTCGLERGDEKSFKEEYWNTPSNPEALFPRNILEPIYEKYLRFYATNHNPSAYDFYIFLLKQTKPETKDQSKL